MILLKRASLDSNGVELLSLIENDQVLKGDVKASSLIRPETSLVKSSLFTNSNNNEPTFVSELQKEIASSDEICFVVSFIKFSGLIKISKQLKEFTDKGKSLNIITTTYMGATDFKAIDKLSTLKTQQYKFHMIVNIQDCMQKLISLKERQDFLQHM